MQIPMVMINLMFKFSSIEMSMEITQFFFVNFKLILINEMYKLLEEHEIRKILGIFY